MKLNYLLPLVLPCLCATSQAAVMSLSGALVPSSGDASFGSGTISGTFDDVSMTMDVTVTFTLDTAIYGLGASATLEEAVAVRLGLTPTDMEVTNNVFTVVQQSEDAAPTGATSIIDDPHIVNGNFGLTSGEEALLAGGSLFIVVDGSDSDLAGAIVATPIPEPSAIILSLVSLSFLARRKRC